MTRNLLFFSTFILFLAACAAPKKTASHSKPPSHTATTPAPATSGTAGIAWKTDEHLMSVLEEAQRQHKPVFLEFYATWCGPCKVMQREVFSKPEVYDFINQNYLSYHVDVESVNGKPIAELYEVQGMPTVVFVDPKGVELERELGLITAGRFKKTAESALKKMK